MFAIEFKPFVPHPLFRGGHVQTLAGTYLPGQRSVDMSTCHRVQLDDGDVVILHDTRPPLWRAGDRAALLMHGLAGCHQSGYMVRIAEKLKAAGVRAFRLDHRGCGAGEGLARYPYNAGRSEDALAALKAIGALCPGSPTAIVGFSLSGNIVLKLLGEAPERLPDFVDRAMAVNPPIDLAAAVECIRRPSCRMYDRHFVGLLYQQVLRHQRIVADPPAHRMERRPRELFEFDDLYTAAVCGYRGAADYYARCSAIQFVSRIELPTLVLAAGDDPLVPARVLEAAPWPVPVKLHVAAGGGHLGYIARGGLDRDRRWMDWRVVDWVTAPAAQRAALVAGAAAEPIRTPP
jgi:predicted alpha/beta-fold hydrolase